MELGESDVKDGGRTQILFLHCLRGKTLQTQNMELSFKLNTLLFFLVNRRSHIICILPEINVNTLKI